jgi:polyphenol oxidase
MSAGPTAWREAGAVRLLTWPALDASGADVAVTARSGGVSSAPYDSLNLSLNVGDDPARVLANRRRLAAAFNASLADFAFAGQVHGAGVRVVGQAERGSGAFSLDDVIGDTDALITSSPGVVLAILTADCVPIVLHDPAAGVLACVHAGWRGTVAGIAQAAVAAMQALGSSPGNVIAGIGPAIAAARYQVGPDVHQGITEAFGAAAAAFIRPDSVPERWRLDLWAANHFALRQAGVPSSQIHVTSIPTGPIAMADPASSPDSAGISPADPGGPAGSAGSGYFFSDRSARPCGRLALVARLRTGGER